MSEQTNIHQAVETDEPVVRSCAEQAYAPYIAVIGQNPHQCCQTSALKSP